MLPLIRQTTRDLLDRELNHQIYQTDSLKFLVAIDDSPLVVLLCNIPLSLVLCHLLLSSPVVTCLLVVISGLRVTIVILLLLSLL
jgi:hypothetical protein